MRDYDPTIDTIERWGVENMKEILATGQVDDWKDPVDPNEPQMRSLRKTIASQGSEMEQLEVEREDLKRENNLLLRRNEALSWLCRLFGSVVLIGAIIMMVMKTGGVA